MYDVLIIGHITKDIIRIPNKPDVRMPGGTAYYTALGLARLGRKVAVLTKVAMEDQAALFGELSDAGVTVFNGLTEHTTVFENSYSGDALEHRAQRVPTVAAPFNAADVERVSGRFVHLGPLTRGELTPDLIKAVRKRTEKVSLDAQGMLRVMHDETVVHEPWFGADAVLENVDILKADDTEAELLVGPAALEVMAKRLVNRGVSEVLLTLADRGSILATKAGASHIAAVPPAACIDATGCGDTFVAGYLHQRIGGALSEDAAWFAAAASSLKLENHGALKPEAIWVERHLARYFDSIKEAG